MTIIASRLVERQLSRTLECDRCSMKNFKSKDELEAHKREKHGI